MKSTHPLQTPAWAEFRKAWGNEILKTPYGLITVHRLPFTKLKIGIFEKGPVPNSHMLQDLGRIGKEYKLIFIKLEPNYVIKKDNISCTDEKKVIKLLNKFGAVRGKRLFTPETFWIDLTKSEEDLLKSFSAKTRYNIRLAQRRGVVVSEDNSDKAFAQYLKLTFETAKRQGFYAHTKHYHQLMWKYLRKANIAHLLIATYKKEVLAAWILFAYDGFLYYPYGASSSKHKNVMANNLMMWEAIKFGKSLGLATFDLWGKEEGKGFTKFKEGYNPKVVKFVGTWDLVINKNLYFAYRLAEKIRWQFLHLKSRLIQLT